MAIQVLAPIRESLQVHLFCLRTDRSQFHPGCCQLTLDILFPLTSLLFFGCQLHPNSLHSLGRFLPLSLQLRLERLVCLGIQRHLSSYHLLHGHLFSPSLLSGLHMPIHCILYTCLVDLLCLGSCHRQVLIPKRRIGCHPRTTFSQALL
jgi:hypothetical protein